MVYRIYAEKRPAYAVEAAPLLAEIRELLGITGVTGLRILNRYDVEGVSEALFDRCRNTVFSEPPVDFVYDELPGGAGDGLEGDKQGGHDRGFRDAQNFWVHFSLLTRAAFYLFRKQYSTAPGQKSRAGWRREIIFHLIAGPMETNHPCRGAQCAPGQTAGLPGPVVGPQAQ